MTQGCEYVPPTRECAENDYEYGAWGECVANTQSRTFVKTGNCDGGFVPGETNLTQSCSSFSTTANIGGGGVNITPLPQPVVPQVLGEKIVNNRYIKSPEFSTVYLLDENSIRNPYPQQVVWESYFGKDFSLVEIISQSDLIKYVLGKNVFFKTGSLIKTQDNPKVYQVADNGVLHAIPSEAVAKKLFGDNWAKMVYDISNIFFQDYTIGNDLE